MFLQRDIEQLRLLTIVGAWRLVYRRRITFNNEFSEGFRIRQPDRETEGSRRLRRERREEGGVCIGCGSPRLATGTLCEPCRDANNRRVQARQERLAAAGLCCKCGRCPRVPDQSRCESCRNARRVRST